MKDFIYENNYSFSSSVCDFLLNYFEKVNNNNNKYVLNIKSNKIDIDIKNYILKQINNDINLYLTNLKKLLNIDFSVNKLNINELEFIKHKCNSEYFFDYYNNYNKNKNKLFVLLWFLIDIPNNIIEFFGNYNININKGKLIIFPAEIFFFYKFNNDKFYNNYLLKSYVYIDR
jgi:hypothetical protein